MVLGRAELENKVVKEAVFDVGDEIVLEDSLGQPQSIAVTDHVGTFVDFTRPLESRAREYAKPIVKWFHVVVNFAEFTEAYLAGLGERLFPAIASTRAAKATSPQCPPAKTG